MPSQDLFGKFKSETFKTKAQIEEEEKSTNTKYSALNTLYQVKIPNDKYRRLMRAKEIKVKNPIDSSNSDISEIQEFFTKKAKIYQEL